MGYIEVIIQLLTFLLTSWDIQVGFVFDDDFQKRKSHTENSRTVFFPVILAQKKNLKAENDV